MIKNYNSSINQNIKSKFVEREILANVNSMVDYIIKQDDFQDAPFNYDDIENLFVDNTEEIIKLQDMQDDDDITYQDFDELQEQIYNLEDENQEPKEWYESYLVTGYLTRKLMEKGEIVIPHMNIWLRQTTGQAIKLDHVISEICEDLDILEGQENSKFWID